MQLLLQKLQRALRESNGYVQDFLTASEIFRNEEVTNAQFVINADARPLEERRVVEQALARHDAVAERLGEAALDVARLEDAAVGKDGDRDGLLDGADGGPIGAPLQRPLLLARAPVQWTVSVSGIAGPDGGTPDKPVGTVWIGWAGAGLAPAASRFVFAGDREAVREQTVIAALQGLLDLLPA